MKTNIEVKKEIIEEVDDPFSRIEPIKKENFTKSYSDYLKEAKARGDLKWYPKNEMRTNNLYDLSIQNVRRAMKKNERAKDNTR